RLYRQQAAQPQGHGPFGFVGAAEPRAFRSLSCEGRGGLGRGVIGLSAHRGHPLPASPCLRRGGGQGKSQRLTPRLETQSRTQLAERPRARSPRAQTPATRVRRRAASAGAMISHSPSNTWPARETIRRPSNHGAVPSVRNTGSQAFWPSWVPKPPGEAPITATGLPPNTRAMSAAG